MSMTSTTIFSDLEYFLLHCLHNNIKDSGLKMLAALYCVCLVYCEYVVSPQLHRCTR